MHRWSAGVLAALTAEAAFTVMLVAVRLVRGLEPWTPVKMPAAFLIGPEAVRPKGSVAADLLLGAAAHVGFAVLIGLAFAAILPHLRLAPLAGGFVTAAILYAFGFWILPQLFPERLAPFWLPPIGRTLQALAHAGYGLILGITYARLTGARALDGR